MTLAVDAPKKKMITNICVLQNFETSNQNNDCSMKANELLAKLINNFVSID